MAPEIVGRREYLGQPVDVWAAGILLYVMLCGNFPFKGFDDKSLFREIEKGDVKFPVWISNEAKKLILNMLKINASERISASEVTIF